MKYEESKVNDLLINRVNRLSLVEQIERIKRNIQLAEELFKCKGCTLNQLKDIKEYQKNMLDKFLKNNKTELHKYKLDEKVNDLLSSLSDGNTSNVD